MRNRFFSSILAITVALFISGCTQEQVVYEFPASSNNLYYCDQHHQMVATIGPNAQAATVLYDGRNHRLPRMPSDIEAYSDGTWTLLFNELGVAALEYDNVPVLTGCTTDEPNRTERSIGKKIFSGAYD